jgi:hypothetical protein
MTVRFLARKLTENTWVTIKDAETKKVLFVGQAKAAVFEDTVTDWDFSNGHIIYIGGKPRKGV